MAYCGSHWEATANLPSWDGRRVEKEKALAFKKPERVRRKERVQFFTNKIIRTELDFISKSHNLTMTELLNRMIVREAQMCREGTKTNYSDVRTDNQ